MGIEELERLVAEGIQAGLKGAELRMWVDGERAKLKAQREAEYEARKEAQEKEIAMLRQQVAALENLEKRKVAQASSVTGTIAWHTKVEHVGDTGSQPHFPTSDLVHASRVAFKNCLEQESRELLNEGNQGPEEACSKEQTLIPGLSKRTTESVEAELRESGSLLVEDFVPTKYQVKKAAAMGAVITQADNRLPFTANKENQASMNECFELQFSRAEKEPQLSGKARKMRKRKRKRKEENRLPIIKGLTNRKSRQVQMRHKHLSKMLGLHYFLKRKQRKAKSNVQILRKVGSTGALWQPSPGFNSFLNRRPTVDRCSTGHSQSSIRSSGPSRTEFKKWPQIPWVPYVHMSRTEIHVSNKNNWFLTMPRRLKLHSQLCWKYRRKIDAPNRSASDGTKRTRLDLSQFCVCDTEHWKSVSCVPIGICQLSPSA